MGSVIKWLFGLIFVVILLLVAAVVILPMVIDPNDYKPQIVQLAKDKLGRDLSIGQDLSLSVFPWLGVETGDVKVGNAEGFKADTFAEIEKLGLKVKLMPLLSKRIEVDTLVLNGLQVNLEKDATGKTNWDDLAGDKQAEDKPESDKSGAPVELSIQGIQIEDARVSWDDRQSGAQYVLDGVRLVTGAVAPGATVPVDGGVTFTSNKPAMTLKATLSGRVSSDKAMAVFSVDGLQLNLDAQGEGLPEGGAKLALKTNLVADTKADTLKLDQLEISGPAMAASGNVDVSALQSDPAAKGHLRIAETNLKTLASMFAAPIETTDPKAMTRASGEVSFSYAGGALKLDPLNISLDESKLSGHLHVLNTAGPVVRANMTLDKINLDRYQPPAAAGSDGKAEKGSPKASAEDPFAALRTLDFVGDFAINELVVSKAQMNNVKAKIVSKKGVLKVDPMAANLYDGSFKGSVKLDASGKTPRIAAKKSLTGIQIGPLLKDVAGEDRLLGRGELHVDITAIGLTEAEVRRSLNGTSRFSFKDGALKGVNIAQLIRTAGAGTGSDARTDFSELSASLTMKNGVISNRDLSAKSPLLRVSGDGKVDLPKDTIDYLVTAELVASLEGQGGKAGSDLAGVPIPVRVTGPLTDPSYRPDLEAALSAQAKAKLDEKKEEVKAKVQEKVEEKLKGSVGGALKGLFN